MIKVGIIGIGGMGRMHFNCYGNNTGAQVVALCDVDPRKRAGDWSSIGLNIDTSKSDAVDLSGIRTYARAEELIADPEVRLVDICLPTPMHAANTIAALRAGKDVLCEKPMAFSAEECAAVEQAARESGRQLMIGHCLRYWPQYLKAHEIISGGEYGRVRYARFFRTSGTPWWSWDGWLTDGSRSGGVVLDMHIHDADTALWWFGAPQQITADGIVVDGLPLTVDALWRYDNGPLVYLHGTWDHNGSPFGYSFTVVMEHATLAFDSGWGGSELRLYQGDAAGSTSQEIPVTDELAYQKEIDDFVDCLATGRRLERVTPSASRLSVETVLEELRQIEAQNSRAAKP